jgi:hypothetical protein
MKKNLAQRQLEKRAARGITKPTGAEKNAQRKAEAEARAKAARYPFEERMADIESLLEDASEVEHQEKQTKKRRTRKPRSTSSESKPRRFTRRKGTDEDN